MEVALLSVLFASVIPGCAVKRWLTSTPSTGETTALPAPSSHATSPAGATSDSGAPARPPAEAPTGPSAAQGARDTLPRQETAVDLQHLAAAFRRAASRDTYRFPAPHDETGMNLYKATLLRLQGYETAHPQSDPALLAFLRGQAYERLHDYDKAIAHYRIAQQSQNGLSPQATTAVEALGRFQAIKQVPITATTPVAYLQALDQQIAAWQELQRQYAGTPYETLAREEEERVDRAKVAFLELNRHRIEDGNESVILAYNQLITKHKESKNRPRYQIKLGDFYFTLAQEYVAQHDPQSLQFDPLTFEELGRAALRLYAQVAQEEGRMEKQEAQGKLEALQAYMARIGRLSR